MVTDSDLYFFDLRGYLLLKGALHVVELNAGIDAILPLKHGEWAETIWRYIDEQKRQ